MSTTECIAPIELEGITSYSTYKSGSMRDCKVDTYNEIHVNGQMFVPRYKRLDERKKENKTISFYESGKVKSIALEDRTEVETSVGTIRLELITFYESGEIDSVFPVNGQIGFGWSMEDEESILEDMKFSFPFGNFITKIIGVRFYETGNVKSLILWPNQKIEIETPVGKYPVRTGFRLYESGQLQSFEPATPIPLETPIGIVMAFDQHANGMDADFNSVTFDEDGVLTSLKTNSDIVIYSPSTKERSILYQQYRLDMTTDEMIKLPIEISFAGDMVTFKNGVEQTTYRYLEHKFLCLHDGYYTEKKCSPGSDCSGCGASCM